MLVGDQVKELAIRNAIVQSAQPHSSNFIWSRYACKWRVDQLALLGFSVSSVYRFKSSMWVGDNVDHSVDSIDAVGHSMAWALLWCHQTLSHRYTV